MAMIDRNFTFATNGTVTANDLHNLIDSATIYQDLITGQVPITSVGTNYELLIADTTNGSAAPNAVTVYDLFEDALTAGTYSNANISAALTYGTATGTRLVSSNATITTGTITTGVIPTLTSSTATFGTTTSTAATITSGTITNLASTTGTIATLNSTTGTIGNLSTTLAGDFTISQGTGTLGTSGATATTYGTTNAIPRITVDAKGRVTAASEVTAPVGFRNRIINGDMRIDQRNAGASVTLINTGIYTVDRWQGVEDSDGAMTSQQDSSAPTGFVNSVKCTTTTADGSLSATQYAVFLQKIEGNNISDLAWGTASAKTITLSFLVRSSLTGTFGGSLSNSANNRSYPFTYSILSADTWEQKAITIDGDTSGTWLTTNGIGINIHFGLGVGSTYSGTAGAWAGSQLVSATGATSVIGTLNANWYITGVQLEAGSTATEFERRPIGTELALCQRYYYQYAPANQDFDQIASRISTTLAWITINTPVSMRTNPSIVLGSAPFGRFVGYDSGFSATTGTVSSISIHATPSSNNAIQGLCTHAAIAAAAGVYSFTFDTLGASSGIGLSAEL